MYKPKKIFLNIIFDSKSKESCEVKLGQGSSHLCDVFIEGIDTGEGKSCLLSVVDIDRFE